MIKMTKPKVTIVDSIMGAGKTNWAIQHLNELDVLNPVMVITPYLPEVDRYIDGIPNRDFKQPESENGMTKSDDLIKLINEREDIVSTHALFKKAGDDVVQALNGAGYTLVIDEAIDFFQIYGELKQDDVNWLKSDGRISIAEDGNISWTSEPDYEGRFSDIKEVAMAGNVYLYNNKIFVWQYPTKIIQQFDSVFVLTYLYDGTTAKSYFDMHGFEYNKKAVKLGDNGRYDLVEYDVQNESRAQLLGLIDIYDGPMNSIGNRETSLSSGNLQRKSKADLIVIQKNLYNYFTNVCKVPQSRVYYSTLKKIEKAIQPKGFKQKTIVEDSEGNKPLLLMPAHNIRATNALKNRDVVAYIYNRFQLPDMVNFITSHGGSFNTELWAASEILQWLFRSAIRDGKPIRAYIPSKRMRDILKAWSDYEI